MAMGASARSAAAHGPFGKSLVRLKTRGRPGSKAVAASLAMAVAFSGMAGGCGESPDARARRSGKALRNVAAVHDVAHLDAVKQPGGRVYEEGSATGSVEGAIGAGFDTETSAWFWLQPEGGSWFEVTVSIKSQKQRVENGVPLTEYEGIGTVKRGRGTFADAQGHDFAVSGVLSGHKVPGPLEMHIDGVVRY